MQVTLTVEDGRLADVDEVAAALERAGLRDVSVLRSIGVITGSVDDEAALAGLHQVDGVAAAERAREIRLPEPE